MNGKQVVCDNIDSLNEALFQHWKNLSATAVAERGAFHVALGGGGTPKAFFERLSRDTVEDPAGTTSGPGLPWGSTHIYFGDERCVPQNHADSNFNMARRTLLSKVSVPDAQIHPMFDPAWSPDENASRYAGMLTECLPVDEHGFPVFDLILLGMGNDGHTASLFPQTPLLNEHGLSVGAQFVDKLDAWRISLTFPTINAAREVVLLVAGESKAEVLRDVADGQEYPVQQVKPDGELVWYLDAAAASLLKA